MWRQMASVLPVLLPTLVITTLCDNNTSSDVIVRYSGHAEANFGADGKVIEMKRLPQDITTSKVVVVTAVPSHPVPTKSPTTLRFDDEPESVVFIPNDAPVVRLEDENRSGVRIHDVISRKTANDVLNKHLKSETETPDIVFIADKNRDEDEIKRKEEKNTRRSEHHKEQEKPKHPKLDCSNLDCNNTIKSICGGKIVNRRWHFRLFLNECYFRKVNCNFKYEVNRYTPEPADKCQTIGAQYVERFYFKPKPLEVPKKTNNNTRRSFSSRKSMSMNIDGQYCSHPCPVSCPDDYEPECAVSATGQRRVFMNHCKLDDNSCLFAVVWHKRPLAECVGGKKADMRQNRFFIGWMQKVGIVDNKGRIVLD